MKIIGLNIEKNRFSYAVVQKRFGKTELVDSFQSSFESEDDLRAALMEKAAAWKGARIVSTIPGAAFTQRLVTFPFGDRKRIEKAVPFELEDQIPFDLDDIVIDHIVLGPREADNPAENKVLCMAVQKTALKQHLDFLSGFGIDPYAVIPSYAALAAVAKMLPHDGVVLAAGRGDVCLAVDGTAISLRSFNDSATAGIRHVLQAIETEHKVRVEKAVLLNAPESTAAALADVGIASEAIQPALGGVKAADPVSLGAALGGEVNFRKGEFAFRAADEGARRRRRTIFAAASVAAVLLAANISVKYFIVRSGYGKLDREIKEIYRQTFPDARPPGDPVREMRDRLFDAKKKFGALGSGMSALDIMKTVTDGIPKEVRVAFTDFLLEGDRLRLQGEALSFESVDRIKSELGKSPLFADVAVQDTRMGVDNKVKFRVEIRLKQAM